MQAGDFVHSKRGEGETSSLSFFIGMIIMILILVALGVIGYILAQQNIDVRARATFDKFLTYHQNCTSMGVTDCACDTFDFTLDFTLLPNDYAIKITQLKDDMLGFDLLKGGAGRIHAETIGKGLCSYAYSRDNDDFIASQAATLTFSPGLNKLPEMSVQKLRTAPSMTNLVRMKDSTCFAWESLSSDLLHPGSFEQTLDAISNRVQSCQSKQQSLPFSRFGLLQLAHHSGNSKSQEHNEDIKSFETATQTKLLQLSRLYTFDNTFASSYDSFKYSYPTLYSLLSKPYPASDFYILSLRLDTDAEGKNTVVLRYLENSAQSKILASSMKDEILRFVTGSEIEVTLEEVKDEQLGLLDTQILDSSSHDIFILDDDYGPLYAQRHEIPAVFIDFIEKTDEHLYLQSHFDGISQGIANGVKQYLTYHPPQEPLLGKNTEPLFSDT